VPSDVNKIDLYIKTLNKLQQLKEASPQYEKTADEVDRIWNTLDNDSIEKVTKILTAKREKKAK
jgi:hypothetical protein